MKAFIDMHNDNVRTVCLLQEMLCKMVEMRHGLATLNSNNLVVYGQKHKV